MTDSKSIQEQLAALRARIARIRSKSAAMGGEKGCEPPLEAEGERFYHPEEFLPGREVETAAGVHFETERFYPAHKRHGSAGIGDLAALPPDILAAISANEVQDVPPFRWAFLDTETTGLAGGAGTYAFLIGVGRITPEGFSLRQFFLRDYAEEASLLTSLEEHLAQFDVLITYNGKAYDQPLLETRYRLARKKPPFSRLAHVDLLFAARRLWKLRLESCRLVELEAQILGVEREGDLPGEMIPYVYFDYLRRREAFRLAPIFHHNANDIVTLACLTGIVPWAFQSPESAPLSHAAEMIGLGRWLQQAGQEEQALTLFRRAVGSPAGGRPLADDLLFRTLWDIALLERRRGRKDAWLASLTELASNRNSYRAKACVELAKYFEHVEKNLTMALEMADTAYSLEPSAELRHRRARLERKLAASATGRLL